jgi:hypothetical protein
LAPENLVIEKTQTKHNMKKSVIASLLTAASLAFVATSYGQGSVQFQNYNFGATSLNAPVTFGQTANVGGVNGVTGVRVGKEFTADLLFSLDGGATYSLLTTAQSGNAGYPTAFAFGTGNDGDAANFAGYFFGNPVTIPGYSSGPVSFIVEAYHGATYAAADWKGQSAAFTMASIATGTTQPSDFAGMTGFVVTVPEPSIFALAGLGAAGLMAFRRKK